VVYGMNICVLFAGNMQNGITVGIPVSPPVYRFCKISNQISVITKVLTAVTTKIAVFWGVVSYSFVDLNRCFGDTCCYLLQSRQKINRETGSIFTAAQSEPIRKKS
jgi:hypothetical protein